MTSHSEINKIDFSPENPNKLSASDYMVAFSGNSQSYCIGMVDIVNSTKTTHAMNINKISRYYEIFINSISKILSEFGGVVVKNLGDCLLYYFPESSNQKSIFGVTSCLDASLAIIQEHISICNRLHNEKLPSMDYRVSADYGSVIIMNASNSASVDIIGPPVNMVSKINRNAAVNGIVLGSDMYEISKNFNEYQFKPIGTYSIGLKNSYPLYSLHKD